MAIEITSLRPGDEQRRRELDVEAFGSTAPFDADVPSLPHEREVCAYDGERLLGAVTTLDGAQWFGGSAVPMGGVASVAVRADARGAGLARSMMEEAFRRMAERREVISTLYPSTATLYRSLGYEIAGDWSEVRLPLTLLGRRGTHHPVQDLPLDDFSAIRHLYDAAAPHHDGWRDRSELVWKYNAYSHGKAKRAFNRCAHDGDRLLWAVAYEYVAPGPAAGPTGAYDLRAREMVATDTAAWRELLGYLGGYSTMGDSLVTSLPRREWAHHLAHPQRIPPIRHWPFMTRLIDVAGAITARGYPRIGPTAVDVTVTDDVIDANNRTIRIAVDGGSAEVSDGDSNAAMVIDQRILASIYTGALAPRVAAHQGLIVDATDSSLDALDSIFPPGQPTCPDFF